jgi:DNA-binding CsgD family transcriptional regulator
MLADNTLLEAKLETLIKLQALSMVEKYDTQKEKIIFLNRVGMTPKSIADILGTSSNSVSVTISKMRQKGEIKDGE